jgi:hypothetical protein
VKIAIGLAVLTVAVPTAGGSSASSPVPPQTLKQIQSSYGQFTYVPALAPRGFALTSWRIKRPSRAELTRRLELTFDRGSASLVWTVSDARDSGDYADCSANPLYGSKRRIGSRVVYYARGNHGDVAWMCFSSQGKDGSRHPLGIDLWVENQAGRPSSLLAMRMVASARLVAPASLPPAPIAAPLPTTTAAPPPPPPPTPAPAPAVGNCAPSYPDFCIPPPPPDLDCKDIPRRGFRVIYNVPDPDPHRFDGDHDGIGCE